MVVAYRARRMSRVPSPSGEQPIRRFVPVSLASFDERVLEMSLYIRYEGGPSLPTLYRDAGLPFTEDDRVRLVEQGVKFLYIEAHHHAAFRRQMNERLTRTFRDESLAAAERARIIRDSCAKMIEDVMVLPGESAPVVAVAEIGRTFVSWAHENEHAFGYLLDMSRHDFYTTTHMVNVGVGCGLLARELFPGDDDLFAVAVQGGLLHDLGKRGIPVEILNKEGRLTDIEWAQVRRHPQAGYDELSKNASIPQAVLAMVRDHHERPDGKGYPHGLSGSGVTPIARLCAVVDTFDAITAARPYRGATHPLETLRMLRDGQGAHFDADILNVWSSLVERLVKHDPSRADPGSNPAPPAPLALRSWRPPCDAPADDRGGTLWGHDKRQFARHLVQMTAKGEFIHQGKTYDVGIGERFNVLVVDFGRGGCQIVTPTPLARDDLMTVVFTPPGQPEIRRTARVVRVRKGRDGGWSAGLCFVADHTAKVA
ncbi:MAG: hypothetical protein HBSAPP03_09810 [Phycisphaerae bacterium]|nr:MAG: hypothetical protein HBSAPP03_09810 [Phycisphaerae bacterium]